MEKIRFSEMDADRLDWMAEQFSNAFSNEPYNEKWTKEKAREQLGHLFEENSVHKYRIILGKKEVGFVLYSDDWFWPEGKTCFINLILIEKKFRKQGIGDRTLEKLEEHLKEKGYKMIHLTAKKTAFPHKWYIRKGFQQMPWSMLAKELK